MVLWRRNGESEKSHKVKEEMEKKEEFKVEKRGHGLKKKGSRE